MKVLRTFWGYGFVVSIWLMASIAQAEASAEQAAHKTVQVSVDRLLTVIGNERKHYKSDPQRFLNAIDTALAPSIDYRRIAGRIMAKYYKKATKEQRKEFLQVFKQSLLKTYAKGLAEYEGYQIKVLPLASAATSKNKKSVKIDLEVVTASGKNFPLSYSMYHNKKGEWKLQNVIINGINVGLTFRNQFAQLMRINKGNIDKVIDAWTNELRKQADQNSPEGASATTGLES